MNKTEFIKKDPNTGKSILFPGEDIRKMLKKSRSEGKLDKVSAGVNYLVRSMEEFEATLGMLGTNINIEIKHFSLDNHKLMPLILNQKKSLLSNLKKMDIAFEVLERQIKKVEAVKKDIAA